MSDKNEDYWTQKAAEHFKITVSEVTKEQRHKAKHIYYLDHYKAEPTKPMKLFDGSEIKDK